MKFPTAALSVTTLSLAMLAPALGQAQTQSPQDTQSSGVNEAQHMVPARALLTHALDANSVHTGDQFRATLSDKVHLNNGVELRRGDALLGNVVDDDMNTVGRSRLALRITEAVLKNGQTIPVKATIVSLYTPDQLSNDSFNAPEELPNRWNDGTLKVDQIGVLHDVDLHSSISSSNSGVFVSTQKNDVKIPGGSELALAIAAQPNAGPTNPGL